MEKEEEVNKLTMEVDDAATAPCPVAPESQAEVEGWWAASNEAPPVRRGEGGSFRDRAKFFIKTRKVALVWVGVVLVVVVLIAALAAGLSHWSGRRHIDSPDVGQLVSELAGNAGSLLSSQTKSPQVSRHPLHPRTSAPGHLWTAKPTSPDEGATTVPPGSATSGSSSSNADEWLSSSPAPWTSPLTTQVAAVPTTTTTQAPSSSSLSETSQAPQATTAVPITTMSPIATTEVPISFPTAAPVAPTFTPEMTTTTAVPVETLAPTTTMAQTNAPRSSSDAPPSATLTPETTSASPVTTAASSSTATTDSPPSSTAVPIFTTAPFADSSSSSDSSAEAEAGDAQLARVTVISCFAAVSYLGVFEEDVALVAARTELGQAELLAMALQSRRNRRQPPGSILRRLSFHNDTDRHFLYVPSSATNSSCMILAVSKNTVTAFRCSDFAQLWSTVTYLNVNLMTTVATEKYFCFRYSQVSDASMGGPNQPICYRTRDGKLHWVGPAGVGAPTNVESAYRLSESGALVVVNTTSTIVYNMSNGKPFLTITYPALAPSPTNYYYNYNPPPPPPLVKSNGFLYGETLLLCVEAKLAGYSMLTGELLWSFDDFASCRLYGSGGWFAGGRTVFLAATTSSITGYHLEDGGLLWSKQNPLSTKNLLWSVADDDSIFAMAPTSTTGISFLRPGLSVMTGNPLTGVLQAGITLFPPVTVQKLFQERNRVMIAVGDSLSSTNNQVRANSPTSEQCIVTIDLSGKQGE